MHKKKSFTLFDIIMVAITFIAVAIFALTFQGNLEPLISYQTRMGTIAVGILSLLYFGFTRDTLKEDFILIFILLILAAFLSLFYFRVF